MDIKVSIEWKSVDDIRDLMESMAASLKVIADSVDTTARRILFYEVDENQNYKRLGGKMFQKVTESKKFAIKPVDAKGNLAQIDGAPLWAVSDAALATLVVAEDGLSCELTPVGPLGSLLLQVKADADLGEGVKEIFGELQIDLVAGEAVAVEIAPVVEVPAEPVA